MAKKTTTERTLQIEYRSVEALIPYANNARRHQNLKELEENILRFGFIDPIGVDKNGVIVWGHGRLVAAKNVGIGIVPVIVLPSHLTSDEIRAIRLAHNKLAERSGWDEALLSEELRELEELGTIGLQTLGFDENELERLLREAEDEIETTAKTSPLGFDDEDDEDDEQPKNERQAENDDEPKPLDAQEQRPQPDEDAPHEKYLELAVVMSEANYFEITKLLSSIQAEFAYEQREEALMHIVRDYLRAK